MIRSKILLSVLIFISSAMTPLSCFACVNAYPTGSSHFCDSFKSAAQCHCRKSGLPASMCTDVKLLYQRLISTFGSLDRTCSFQNDTSKENCMDSWQCCINGGKNARGEPCNGTGRPCIG